ncbi:unnamed protein product [Urochloa humidicola]
MATKMAEDQMQGAEVCNLVDDPNLMTTDKSSILNPPNPLYYYIAMSVLFMGFS